MWCFLSPDCLLWLWNIAHQIRPICLNGTKLRIPPPTGFLSYLDCLPRFPNSSRGMIMVAPNLNQLEFWGEQLSIASRIINWFTASIALQRWHVQGGHRVCYQTIYHSRSKLQHSRIQCNVYIVRLQSCQKESFSLITPPQESLINFNRARVSFAT